MLSTGFAAPARSSRSLSTSRRLYRTVPAVQLSVEPRDAVRRCRPVAGRGRAVEGGSRGRLGAGPLARDQPVQLHRPADPLGDAPEDPARRDHLPTRTTRGRPPSSGSDDRVHGRVHAASRRCSGGSATRMPRWVLIGVAVILWSLATGGTGPGDRLPDAVLHALPRRDRRGGLRAGRAGDALGPVPGRSPRAGDVVVLHGDPGRQRAGVRDRLAGGGDVAGLARGVLRRGVPRHRPGRAVLLHEGTAAALRPRPPDRGRPMRTLPPATPTRVTGRCCANCAASGRSCCAAPG